MVLMESESCCFRADELPQKEKDIVKVTAAKNELLKNQLMVIEEPPLKEYIPKKSTQQEDFLKRFPEYDGRGLLIGVIDSCVEVGMPGLQKTSTGLPKIIDCYDFTGAGDVDTSHVTEAYNGGTIIGLSGRELKIPLHWKNPSGQWHLGSISYEDLCYGMDKDELKDNEIVMEKVQGDGILIETIGSFYSPYTIVDCIVWFEGQKWLACIDTSFSKNLEDVKVLTNYRDEHEYGLISGKRSYCVRIQNDGNLFELNFSRFDHGTLVSKVAAAYFSQKDSHRNGLAPGSQIVSLVCLHYAGSKRKNINSYKDAFRKCIELKVDIINASVSLTDEICEIIKEVTSHGIIVVVSAGNDGPIYSSIKRYYLDDNMFVIGSVLTSEIKSIINNEIEESQEIPTLLQFSARGLTKENQCGVNFTADGVATILFPEWCSCLFAICGGTSIASPNFVGSLACLLSGLKANSIKYSPAMLKVVLSNTAYLPKGGDKIGFGNGIIQINSAFEYFKNFHNKLFKLDIPNLYCQNKKGILWVAKKSCDPVSKTFDVIMTHSSTDENNNNYENFKWILQSASDCKHFIKHSDTVSDDKFTVTIDASSLESGKLYFTEIYGIDSSNSSMGPLFRFPVTVIVPEENCIAKEITLLPQNFFLHSSTEIKKCVIKETILDEIPEDNEIRYQYSFENENGLPVLRNIVLKKKDKTRTYEIQILPNKLYEIAIFLKDENLKGIPLKNSSFKCEIKFE